VPPWNASQAEYKAALLSQYGSQLLAVLRRYPLESFVRSDVCFQLGGAFLSVERGSVPNLTCRWTWAHL
jgi:hypothetical protein